MTHFEEEKKTLGVFYLISIQKTKVFVSINSTGIVVEIFLNENSTHIPSEFNQHNLDEKKYNILVGNEFNVDVP